MPRRTPGPATMPSARPPSRESDGCTVTWTTWSPSIEAHPSPSFAEHAVDEGDRGRALADGGGDALLVTGADVADREHARERCFEQVGRPLERPERCGQVRLREVGSRADESTRVERYAVIEPLRARRRAGHDEDVPYFLALDGIGVEVPPAHARQRPLAFQFDDLRAGVHDDIGTLLDASDQVARHPAVEVPRAHEEMDAPR